MMSRRLVSLSFNSSETCKVRCCRLVGKYFLINYLIGEDVFWKFLLRMIFVFLAEELDLAETAIMGCYMRMLLEIIFKLYFQYKFIVLLVSLS